MLTLCEELKGLHNQLKVERNKFINIQRMRRKLTYQGYCALSEKEGRKKKNKRGGRKKGGVKKKKEKQKEGGKEEKGRKRL